MAYGPVSQLLQTLSNPCEVVRMDDRELVLKARVLDGTLSKPTQLKVAEGKTYGRPSWSLVQGWWGDLVIEGHDITRDAYTDVADPSPLTPVYGEFAVPKGLVFTPCPVLSVLLGKVVQLVGSSKINSELYEHPNSLLLKAVNKRAGVYERAGLACIDVSWYFEEGAREMEVVII